jgi:endonuclease/exonuclease/phosphatase (EEP) superfamily protein YafD
MGCPQARHAAKVDPKIALRRCELIEAMIRDHNPTFVALQETPPECSVHLRGKSSRRYEVVEGRNGLLTLYSTDWSRPEHETTLANELRATMLLLKHGIFDTRVRLWNIHFWSRFQLDTKQISGRVRQFVNDQVKQYRATSTSEASEIIVGDFNMSPYAEFIAGHDCLWANQSLHWALAKERSVRRDPTKKSYRPLFNPSWELLGHHEPPLGTYYYEKSAEVDGPWYVFDQMLMSPAHGLTNERHATILGKAGDAQLWSDTKSRRPDDRLGSDHYPVLVKFKLS